MAGNQKKPIKLVVIMWQTDAHWVTDSVTWWRVARRAV